MKIKNLVWTLVLIIGGIAAAYIGTDEVDVSDYWVLGLFTVFGAWWFSRWIKKDGKDSSKFIKKINEKIWFVIACLAIPLSLFSQSTEVAIEPESLNNGLLFATGVLGVLLHVISKIRDIVSTGVSKWSELKIKVNWLGIITLSASAIVVVGFAIMGKDYVNDIYPLNYFTIGILGYTADSALKNWTTHKSIKK